MTLLAATTSTNDLAREAARAGSPHGATWVAEQQTAGRGRRGHAWISPSGEGLLFSVLVRTPCVPSRIPPVALVVGLAARDAVSRAAAGAVVTIKWPNDVLVGDRKLAGILTEATGIESTGSQSATSPGEAGDAVVIGIGINVSTTPEELPQGPGGLSATSLLAEGIPVERDVLLVEVLRALGQWLKTYSRSPDPEQSGLLAQYQRMSATIGRGVRVELPGGAALSGMATAIDTHGQLIVEADGGSYPVAAGDVIHVR
jgi:BirA family biotin operon repressor/biotin-[acetyl-CoA-carboxylase] ligase